MSPLVVLDPGHGGQDPGACGNGLRESDVVLEIAKQARDGLESRYDVDVKLTRTRDVFVGLEARAAFANKLEAEYFVSIHINAANGRASGYEDYIHESAGPASPSAKRQAAVHAALMEALAPHKVSDRGRKKANFVVLRDTKMPALLTENLFIDNPADAALLSDDAFVSELAQAHVAGIARALGLAEKTGAARPKVPRHRRHLALVSPYMTGTDVKRLQRTLGIEVDGEYGPVTARAVEAAKVRLGFPPSELKAGASIEFLELLYGERALPAVQRKRAARVLQSQKRRLARDASTGGRARLKALAFALEHEGTSEEPRGSNRGPVLDAWQRECGHPAFGRGEQGWPWCGVFVHACYLHGAGIDLDNRIIGTWWIYEAARSNTGGLRRIPLPQAKGGDLVLLYAIGKHVGIVREDYKGGNLKTIEGNAGQQVSRLEQPPSKVVAIVRVETGPEPLASGPVARHAARRVRAAKITARTRLLAEPSADQAAVERFLLARKHGKYSADAVRRIAKLYFDTAASVGLDPVLAISQMVIETGGLTSDWSQPPRRNPAGIGVTGKPGAGLSFPTWKDAVRAHVGRLLAYALPRGDESDEQRALIDEALRWRPLPDTYRGCAPTLAGLNDTWAKSDAYAAAISRVANEIRSAAP